MFNLLRPVTDCRVSVAAERIVSVVQMEMSVVTFAATIRLVEKQQSLCAEDLGRRVVSLLYATSHCG